VYDLQWSPGVTYGQVRQREEFEFSTFHFEEASTELHFKWFKEHEAEAQRLLAREDALVLPAYDEIMKASHAFNILDARGAISVTERRAYIRRIATLAKLVAEKALAQREDAGFPLGDASSTADQPKQDHAEA
ncbi:MAG: glycine--tRNA ligase subunit alpha, partial [Myxococcota bacterium]